MATNTPNYNLELPGENDFYNINVVNENNTKIDIALKEIDNKMLPKIDGAIEGNFPKINSDGSISDSGYSPDDFTNSDHNEKSICNSDGVHSLRYFEEKLQAFVDGKWQDITTGGNGEILVEVFTEIGATVTATDGKETLEETNDGEKITFKIPNYGTWTFTARLEDKELPPVELEIGEVKIYSITLSFFEKVLTIVTQLDEQNLVKSVTITKDDSGKSETYPKTSDPLTVTLKEKGNYTIIANMNDDTPSLPSKVEAIDDTPQSVQIDFAIVVVTLTIDENSTISPGTATARKGDILKNPFMAQENANLFILPEHGLWTFTVEFEGDTIIEEVDTQNLLGGMLPIHFYGIYGVEIDLSNSNPETAVTYTDKAVGMTAGSAEWDNTPIFKNIYPVLMTSALQPTYLKKDNFNETLYGVTVSPNENLDNFMIAFPRMGYKVSKTDDNKLKVQMTAHPNKEGFSYAPFSMDSEGDCQVLYLGMFLSTLRTPMAGKEMRMASYPQKFTLKASTLDEFSNRYTYASNNGEGWYTMGYYQLVLLQCLYLLRYKNLNSQGALGKGYTKGNNEVTYTQMNLKSKMYDGEFTGQSCIRFAGLEHFYGNLRCIIDGIFIRSDGSVYTCKLPKNFNSASDNYTRCGYGVTAKAGYMKNVVGSNDLPFFPTQDDGFSGSNSTYFCDNVSTALGMMPSFGGDWDDDTIAGAFSLQFDVTSNDESENKAFRLMKLIKQSY